jgi:DNA/RNA-binding domain of Phe-tRNA-synthetase-like protein
MRLRVGEDVLALFPAAAIGAIEIRGCDNSQTSPEIAAELRRAEDAARRVFSGVAPAAEPRIACWREAYRRFGADPRKSPSSIESLLRRVLRGEALRPILPLVDLYNAVSLERVLPAGGEDLGQVRGDIVLCRAGDSEPPVLLLGDAAARPPHAGEVIYRDDLSALCRRWNWREAERTKLSATTRDCLLVLEALPPAGHAELAAALADLAGRVARHCGGHVRTAILDAGRPEIELG